MITENLREDEPEDIVKVRVRAASWMLSFADVSALMLTFFVLLFSMSTLESYPDLTVTSQIITSKETSVDEISQPVSDLSISQHEAEKLLSPEYLSVLMKKKIEELGIRQVALTLRNNSFTVSLPESLLFAPGSNNLSRRARRVLFDLSSTLQPLDNMVYIVGHVAPGDDQAADLDDSWGLSLERATLIAMELRNSGYAGSMLVSGGAETDYQKLANSVSDANTREFSRRVDIVITSERGSGTIQ